MKGGGLAVSIKSLSRVRGGVAVLAVVVAVALLPACAGTKKDTYVEKPVDELYNTAMDQLNKRDYEAAAKSFDEVDRQHPNSVWATKAQLMAAYALYENNKQDQAIVDLDRFIELHPGYKDVAYAYYLKALCYYEQIADVQRDQKITEEAQKSLQEVIDRFPSSKYAHDARFKLDLVRDHLAGKELAVGRFYEMHHEYLAAINRYKNVVDHFQTTTQVPEALHRMIECYEALGLTDAAQKTAAVLGYNYPGSEWYVDTYSLVKGGQPGEATASSSSDSGWFGWLGDLF